MRFYKIIKNKHIKRMVDTLKLGRRSEKTILNYSHAIARFLNYFKNKDISLITEDDIVEYLMNNYINKNYSATTYNMNISAIKYFFSVNFNKDFNSKLLPHAKLTKKIPLIIDEALFTKIVNEETNLKYKCWLLLAYYSGLRVNEISTIKIKDIFANEHKLKVLGKRNKERFTYLPDITIRYLREYYKQTYYKNNYFKKLYSKGTKSGYLFEGINGNKHINSKTLTNYFSTLKQKYNLDKNLSFHSLRHSFATNFIKNGGNPFTLQSMLRS